jgi:hypothetical protein
LNTAASGTTGISIGGNTVLDAECGVYSNSTDRAASVSVGGSSGRLKAASLYMAGDSTDPLVISANRNAFQKPAYNPFEQVVSALPTTYTSSLKGKTPTIGLDAEGVVQQTVLGTCADRSGSPTKPGYNSTTKTLYLPPGYYSTGVQVKSGMCDDKGSKVDVANVVLLPGDFYLDNGGFSQEGLSLVGKDISIVLMNDSNFRMNAGQIELSPYPQGKYANITVIGTNTPVNIQAGFVSNTITKVDITGNFVMPGRDFSVAGNVSFTKNKCLTLVAYSLKLNSSGDIGGGCKASKMTLSAMRGPPLRE